MKENFLKILIFVKLLINNITIDKIDQTKLIKLQFKIQFYKKNKKKSKNIFKISKKKL